MLTVAIVGVLSLLGTGVAGRLTPTSLEIPGTPSAKGTELLSRHFGESAPFAILLRGPAAAIERQGPEVIRALHRADPRVTTLSPWDRGSVGPLRPGPRRALIIADFHVGLATAVNHSVDQLNRILAANAAPPLRATQTSYATLSREIQDRSISAAERSELIALPILLIVLLLVFRSPIAAAIPLAFGASTVAASRGLLYLVAGAFEVDAFALTVCTMIGLALGVDYSLLMVSRFREELDRGLTPAMAAACTRATAGRTSAFAGSTLLLSMLVAFFVVPGSLLASLAATVALVVALSVAIAILAAPALLALVGQRVNLWRIGAPPSPRGGALMGFVSAALRRPLAAALAIGTIVLLLAAPAVGLKTGPPSPAQLPGDDPARRDSELIAHSVGAGFESPFVLVAASRAGPITEPARLKELSQLQQRIARQPGVQAVVGPARLQRALRPLRRQGGELLEPHAQLARFSRLAGGLTRASAGVGTLRGGISEASRGAGLLAYGSGRAGTGARLIGSGLARAGSGTVRLLGALRRLRTGATRLRSAQERILYAHLQLKTVLHEMPPGLRRNALRRARVVQSSLGEEARTTSVQLQGTASAADASAREVLDQLEAMTAGRSDPAYAPALTAARQTVQQIDGPVSSAAPAAPGGLLASLAAQQETLSADHAEAAEVSSYLASTISNLKRISAGASRLTEIAQRVLAADKKLERGTRRLVTEVAPVGGRLQELAAGAARLAAGIARIGGGSETLAKSLAVGYSRSLPLQTGLHGAGIQVLAARNQQQSASTRLRRASPGLFNSGYFVLSALDGAPPQLRTRAAEAVDFERSGQAATMLVFSRYALNSPGSIAFQRRLEDDAAGLTRRTDLQAAVAGGPAVLNDYSRVTRERFPVVVVAICLATFLVLIFILRAIPLAALAVGLNLATVGVAFGVLTLFTDLPASFPLGGHEYVESVGATMIFGIVFGLSIDYAVFLLVRMKEHRDAHLGAADDEAQRASLHSVSIEYGLGHTARVITGAAAIMLAVFAVFSGAAIATVSQLGLGLTVAVFLDATVVRIVLLPALMLLLGERVWWFPRSLDRVLPRISV